MSKCVFLADVHLGASNRYNDIIWALGVVHQYCKRRGISNVVILGDLFHDRQSLDIDMLCGAHDFFKMVRDDGQDWAAFPGNHDMFLKHDWSINSIKPLREVMTFIDTVKIIKIGNRRFWVLPFIYSEKAYLKVLRRIEEQYQDGDVLLTHIGVNNAIKNICFLLQEWTVVDFTASRFQQIFCGHFHVHQQVGENTWYVGSLIPFKFDEGDSEHGFVVYDTETGEHEFLDIWDTAIKLGVKNPPPQYRTFSDELLADKEMSDVDNNHIRIMLSRDFSQNERQAARDRLLGLGARSVSFNDTLVKRDVVELDDNVTDSLRMDELFAKLYDSDVRGTKGLTRALALRLNLDIIQEGDAIYLERLECD